MEKVSIVFPVWNEEENIDVLYARVKKVCQQANVEYEMVFVDNGSTDRSLEHIKRLHAQDQGVTYVSLSRNFGHQNALFAGMSRCTGDAIVTMDADLQHPPALIPEMVARWRAGAEVVYTTKRHANVPLPKYVLVKLFYWFISRMSGMVLDFGLSDFRLLDRKVAEAILQIPEYHKFLRGQVKWVGFKQEGLSYDVEGRHGGSSKFSYGHLWAFALDGLFAFSRYPLRVVAVVGLLVAFLSSLYMVYVLWVVALNFFSAAPTAPLPPGWATLAMAVLFLGSAQLVAIAIVGEYIGRVYDQTKGRPVFIVREASRRSVDEEQGHNLMRGAGQPVASLNG